MKVGSIYNYKTIVLFLIEMEIERINKFLKSISKQNDLENKEIEKPLILFQRKILYLSLIINHIKIHSLTTFNY